MTVQNISLVFARDLCCSFPLHLGMHSKHILAIVPGVSVMATVTDEERYRQDAAECDLTLSEYGRIALDRFALAVQRLPLVDVPVATSGKVGDAQSFPRRYQLLCKQREAEELIAVSQADAALAAKRGNPYVVKVRRLPV